MAASVLRSPAYGLVRGKHSLPGHVADTQPVDPRSMVIAQAEDRGGSGDRSTDRDRLCSYGPPRQWLILWVSGRKPCSTPHRTACVRLLAPILRYTDRM